MRKPTGQDEKRADEINRWWQERKQEERRHLTRMTK
jgi:hypothetical protein